MGRCQVNTTGSQNQGQEVVLPTISQERQRRIREVQNLFHFGWKVSEIAEHYHISRRQVFKDLKAGKLLARTLSQRINQDELLDREINILEESRRRELRAYQLETNPFVKVALMRNAIAIHEKLMRLYQGVGFIDKVADKLDLNHGIDFTDDEVRAAYYQFLKIAKAKSEQKT
jgi:hypothetical protein